MRAKGEEGILGEEGFAARGEARDRRTGAMCGDDVPKVMRLATNPRQARL